MLVSGGARRAARNSENVIFGDGGNVVMLQRMRVHGNFIEYVPLGLLLLLVLELNGAAPLLLNALGGSLLVARVLHAFGLSRVTGTELRALRRHGPDLARAGRGERPRAVLVLGGLAAEP